ncbi:MAG: prolipoprotein diacylglyceryl transferase [Bacteroidetes bacterium]|nr:prolipoprotein diacylglyceryl transferase [Bacteroidota bacterium]
MNILSYITWDASPIIFSLGPITARWYSLMFAITFVVGYAILQKMFDNERSKIRLDTLAIFIMVGTVAGARLGHCLFYEPVYYLSHPSEIFKVWNGGLASHGGAIGILLAIWLFTKSAKNYSFIWIVDRVVIVVALGGLFIRTGNFFNSEILGKPTDLPWAIIFSSVDYLPRHPSMLYEGLAYFGIFIFLYRKYLKEKFSPKPGMLFGLFLFLVFSARFVLEFTKEIQSSFEANLPIDMGQILSMPFAIAGIIIIYLAKKGKFA